MLWCTWIFLPSEGFPWLPQKQPSKNSVHTGTLHQKLPKVLPLDIPILSKTISGKLKANNIQNRHKPGTGKATTSVNSVSLVNLVVLTENSMC